MVGPPLLQNHTQYAGYQERLVEVVAEQIKAPAGDHPRAVDIRAERKHQPMRFNERRRRHNTAHIVHLRNVAVESCSISAISINQLW